MRLLSRLLFMLALLGVSLAAQTPSQTTPTSGKTKGIPKLIPAKWEQYAVYWTAEAGWKTEIHLRNNLPSQALSVTPVLRAADGTERALPTVTISPNDVADVDVVAAITSAAPQLEGEYGSLVLRYTAPVERALSAAVMIQLPGTPIEFHLDAFPKAPRAMTGGREGIWWLARESVTDWLVLANTSGSSLTALLTLYEFDGKSLRKKLTLGPRQTTRLSVLSLVKQGGLVGSFGGISIDAGPRAADFDSAHFIYDEPNGFLALMKMFDRDSDAAVGQRSLTNLQWTIRAPMLPLTSPDPALGVPAGTTLKPAVFLRNASSNAYTAKVTFNWRSDKITGKRMLAVPLQPNATAKLDVAALQADGTIPASAQWAYVNITAPIKPDDLLAVATSFDATLRFGAQTPFTDQAANHWTGGIWEVDPNHDSLIAIGNAGNTATKAQITFYFNSGQSNYMFERTLAPDEQVWLDVGQLIRSQIPDLNGKTIPLSVMSGSYDVNSVSDKLTDGLFEGKLIVDKTYGYAVHGCEICCPEYDERFIVQDPLDLLVGGSNDQAVGAFDACHNQSVQLSTSSWDTADSSIATAVANPDGRTGHVTGKAAGSTTDRAYVRNFAPDSRGYCRWWTVPTDGTVNVSPKLTGISPAQGPIGTTVSVTISGSGFGSAATVNAGTGITVSYGSRSDTSISAGFAIAANAASGNHAVSVIANGQTSSSVNFYVQIPNHLQMVLDTTGGLAQCPSLVVRQLKMRVVDQSGNNTPILGAVAVQENFLSSPQNTCGNGQPIPSACAPTAGDGTFTDNITINSCSAAGSSCGYTLTDEWQSCPQAVAPGNIGRLVDTVHANQVTVNGVASPNPPGSTHLYSIPPGTQIQP